MLPSICPLRLPLKWHPERPKVSDARGARHPDLTFMSDIPTMDVAMSDNWSGIPAPPSPAAPPSATQPTRSIYSFSEAELVDYFALRLKLANRPPTIGLHPDGSPAIKSLIGVWLISQVGGIVGKKRLVNLSKV